MIPVVILGSVVIGCKPPLMTLGWISQVHLSFVKDFPKVTQYMYYIALLPWHWHWPCLSWSGLALLPWYLALHASPFLFWPCLSCVSFLVCGTPLLGHQIMGHIQAVKHTNSSNNGATNMDPQASFWGPQIHQICVPNHLIQGSILYTHLNF